MSWFSFEASTSVCVCGCTFVCEFVRIRFLMSFFSFEVSSCVYGYIVAHLLTTELWARRTWPWPTCCWRTQPVQTCKQWWPRCQHCWPNWRSAARCCRQWWWSHCSKKGDTCAWPTPTCIFIPMLGMCVSCRGLSVFATSRPCVSHIKNRLVAALMLLLCDLFCQLENVLTFQVHSWSKCINCKISTQCMQYMMCVSVCASVCDTTISTQCMMCVSACICICVTLCVTIYIYVCAG